MEDNELWNSTDWNDESEKPIVKEQIKQTRRKTECLIRETKNIYRRAFSETQLLDVLGEKFVDGFSYHCITAGDVDSLSYLNCILRQQNLDYVLISTWCMASDDVLQIEQWLKEGKLKKIDFYLGEIFPNSYQMEWKKLNEIFKKYNCGRIAVFKNHSKIFSGYGNKFSFAVESSANINTNPRTENGCITIGTEIFEFYKSYFDDIISFVK